ncbi:hypothetical protein AX16_009012 [Volvariella volvacea WC 439]|nr:hypothetical protein AX16_009012 [Volvariella volvacea WC 439]
MATGNAEHYHVVDLTGSTDGATIRARIFTKLNIPVDIYHEFSIYQTELSSYALGPPLGNTALYQLCLEKGNPTGDLRFFVSTLPDGPHPHFTNSTKLSLNSPL